MSAARDSATTRRSVLRQFYRSHRAATRAKLYVWRANEPDNGSTERWLATAREYLELALDAARLATG